MRHSTKHPGCYYRLNAKGERRYQISYTDSAGKRVFKTVEGQLKDAVRERAKILERMHQGERVITSKMTVKELVDEYLKTQTGHLRPTTYAAYQYNLDHYVVPRLGHKKLSELSVGDIANFIVDMRKPRKKGEKILPGFKKWTIQGCLSPMSSMFRFAVRNGWMSKNPIRDLEKQERPKADQQVMEILSSDEIAQVIATATDTWKLLFKTAVFSGLRKGELLSLEWRDIDLMNATIKVREGKTAAATREVDIPGFLVRAFSAKDEIEGLVFRFDKDNVNRALTETLKKAGVKHVRFHDLRHTYASILVSKGVPLTYIAEQLGHANPKITLGTYAKLWDGEKHKEETMNRMEEDFAGVAGG